jgi:transcriptional regulator with XRE-family HTH domain
MPRVSRLKLPPLEIDQKTIGRRLARIRKQKGLTQKTLAEKMGLIQALVSAYELGKIRLNAEMVIRFAKALEVSADEILGLKNNGGGKENPSLRLIRRINRIESLPPARQKTVLKAIDFMLDAAERQD